MDFDSESWIKFSCCTRWTTVAHSGLDSNPQNSIKSFVTFQFVNCVTLVQCTEYLVSIEKSGVICQGRVCTVRIAWGEIAILNGEKLRYGFCCSSTLNKRVDMQSSTSLLRQLIHERYLELTSINTETDYSCFDNVECCRLDVSEICIKRIVSETRFRINNLNSCCDPSKILVVLIGKKRQSLQKLVRYFADEFRAAWATLMIFADASSKESTIWKEFVAVCAVMLWALDRSVSKSPMRSMMFIEVAVLPLAFSKFCFTTSSIELRSALLIPLLKEIWSWANKLFRAWSISGAWKVFLNTSQRSWTLVFVTFWHAVEVVLVVFEGTCVSLAFSI